MKSGLASASEIDAYAVSLAKFQQGLVTAEQFTAIRLQHGIYGQRQEHAYMVRIKIPGGRLTRLQLLAIGNVLENYSELEFVNITTRQDIQMHFVNLKHTAEIMKKLSIVGLTTREACGNTVRNITACSMAGICKKERTDISPFLDDTVKHFLRHPLTQHLPRKFKMSFSSCESDCAQGMMHDLAVIAVQENGSHGFKIMAGGGLGHKPREAIVLESCIAASELMAAIEAVICVHHKYSDRRKRAKSRIKFLVERFGVQGFIDKYREELQRTKAATKTEAVRPTIWLTPTNATVPGIGAPKNITAQRQKDSYAIPLFIEKGDFYLHQIERLAAIMDQFNLTEIRTTVDQNLIVPDVHEKDLGILRKILQAENFKEPESTARIIACPGNWTCRLGITNARALADKLVSDKSGLRINISGCHNGCAQPAVADIGVHGEGKRLFGKLIPFYQLHLGGDATGNGGLADCGPEVPSAHVVSAINRISESFDQDKSNNETFRQWVQRKDALFFTALLEKFTSLGPDDLAYLLVDHGAEQQFRVSQLGGGECAGIAQESVSALLGEIAFEQSYRKAFQYQSKLLEGLDCCENIIRLCVAAMLAKQSKSTIGDVESLVDSFVVADVSKSSIGLLCKLLLLDLDREKISPSLQGLSMLGDDVDQLCEIVKMNVSGSSAQSGTLFSCLTNRLLPVIDLSRDDSPFNILRAKKVLQSVNTGQVLPVLLGSDSSVAHVSTGLRTLGYKLLISESGEKRDERVIYVLNTGVENAVPRSMETKDYYKERV